MLITAAIVPGPPAFVPQLMGSAASELDDLRHAADRVVGGALSDLLAVATDSLRPGSVTAQLVVVGPGQPGEFDATGPVSFDSFGREVTLPALVEEDQSVRPLPTPLMVLRYLASRDVAAHPEHAVLWSSARWITSSGTDAAALGEALRTDELPVVLILLVDGAACHGPKAPRAEDSRAPAYEDAVCTALASGQPDRLSRVDLDLGRELGSTAPELWPLLVAATDGAGIGELVWRGAPYGVGWAVASWRRP